MLFESLGQAYVFLATVYGGIMMGLFQDLVNFLRILLHARTKLSALLDWFFWISIGSIAFWVLLRANDGDLRIYQLLGFAVGWLLYSLSIGKLISMFLVWLERNLQCFGCWIMSRPLIQKILK